MSSSGGKQNEKQKKTSLGGILVVTLHMLTTILNKCNRTATRTNNVKQAIPRWNKKFLPPN